MPQNKLSFYLIVISQFIGLVGGAVLRFAISLHVLDLTGSAEVFATMVAISFLPMVLFSPIGGAIADRFSKKVILVIVDSAKTLLAVTLALILFGGSQSVILLGAAITLLSVLATAYHPAVTASLPAILKPEELAKANGTIQGIQAASNLAGPVLAGFLFGWAGVNNLVAICAAFFLFSSLINIFIKIPYNPRKAEGNIIKAIAADLKEGFIYITKENPILFKAATIFTAVIFFHQAMLSVTFPYMIRVAFEMSEEMFGFASAAIGASTLAASLAAGKLKNFMQMKHLSYYITIIGFATIPIAISVLFVSDNSRLLPYLLLTGGFMIIMFSFILCNILITTYTQTTVPQQIVGKTISIIVAIANMSVPIGQFTLGFLIENLGQAQFALYLSICIITLLLGILARKRLSTP